MSFFDSWCAFNTCFDERNFTALTQLVGYKLLAVDNERQHPESFLLADRELQLRTGIKSISTIVEARRQLKNAGLIDFKAAKGKPTRYWLVKKESSKIGSSIEQVPSKIRASGFISYTPIEEEKEKEPPQAPPPGARSERVLTKSEVEDRAEFAEGLAAVSPSPTPTPDLFKVWGENRLPWLGADQKYRLADYEEGYGYETVKRAILATKDKFSHPTFARFEELLKTQVAASPPIREFTRSEEAKLHERFNG